MLKCVLHTWFYLKTDFRKSTFPFKSQIYGKSSWVYIRAHEAAACCFRGRVVPAVVCRAVGSTPNRCFCLNKT